MAKKPKRPELTHCTLRKQVHPTAPWRVWFSEDVNGKAVRRAKCFADEDSAWTWAESKDNEITNHGVRFGAIPPEARRAYDAFRDVCADLEKAGVKPPRFEDLVADAVARLRSSRASLPVSQVVAQFLDMKEREVKSDRHLSDLKSRLGFFEQTFGNRAIGSIGTAEINGWLGGLSLRRASGDGEGNKKQKPRLLSARSVAHYRAKLHALFAFAENLGWTQSNPVAHAIAPKPPRRRPQIYTAKHAKMILEAAQVHKPRLVPVLALGFFCGLRTAEILRLDWKEIDLNADHLRIDRGKTGSRLATMTEAARLWLSTHAVRQGPVWTASERSLHGDIDDLFSLPGMEDVKHLANGMRHTFISCRCAETRNPAAVADECGTSPAVIQRHYRETVTPEDAEAFFAIRPKIKVRAKVIHMGQAG